MRGVKVDNSKRDRESGARFAKGGQGAPNKMLRDVPAEAAPPGRTGPTRVKAPGAKGSRGGGKTGTDVGGLARPAKPGATGA
jgi:hypothetical protein